MVRITRAAFHSRPVLPLTWRDQCINAYIVLCGVCLPPTTVAHGFLGCFIFLPPPSLCSLTSSSCLYAVNEVERLIFSLHFCAALSHSEVEQGHHQHLLQRLLLKPKDKPHNMTHTHTRTHPHTHLLGLSGTKEIRGLAVAVLLAEPHWIIPDC